MLVFKSSVLLELSYPVHSHSVSPFLEIRVNGINSSRFSQHGLKGLRVSVFFR